ncbi:hypothetical protein [Chitinasiproducens palmae]|uniref:Uncharacterized protein n=1 Tax=Chitinasiproducens palmae TaxID=1770053 RepID=A0A1H2PLN7_9BURK|nr:hypothetical protein [Chitinasiproducens palmae]SDV46945.1 hypothetical protein SAMN05216551_102125 [Chitinasiproducens palmae]
MKPERALQALLEQLRDDRQRFVELGEVLDRMHDALRGAALVSIPEHVDRLATIDHALRCRHTVRASRLCALARALGMSVVPVDDAGNGPSGVRDAAVGAGPRGGIRDSIRDSTSRAGDGTAPTEGAGAPPSRMRTAALIAALSRAMQGRAGAALTAAWDAVEREMRSCREKAARNGLALHERAEPLRRRLLGEKHTYVAL